MRKKFCSTCNKELETHIWINFCLGQVMVETNKKVTYNTFAIHKYTYNNNR